MDGSQLLEAEMLKARAGLTRLKVKRQAKADELKAFENDHASILEQHQRLVTELEATTRELSQFIIKHPYLYGQL